MLNFIKKISRFIRNIFLFTITLSIVIFMASNREMVKVYFSPLPFEIETRMFLIIFFSFASGAIFSTLFFWPKMIKGSIEGLKNRMLIKKLSKNSQNDQ